MQNTLTVVVTNYNYARYLKECIDSILLQKYKPQEILIIDDCSTDDSVKVLNDLKHKDNKIRLVLNKENMGLAKTKNKAIRLAKGNLIRTIDSDDFFVNPHTLENEISVYEKYENQDNKSVIAYSEKIFVDEIGNRINGFKNEYKEGHVLYSMVSREATIPRDLVFSKEQFFSVGGYDEGSKLYVDWCFKLKLAAMYNYYSTKSEGAAFRKHGTGMSSFNRKIHNRAQIYSYQKLLEKLKFRVKITVSFHFWIYFFKRQIIHYFKLAKSKFRRLK